MFWVLFNGNGITLCEKLRSQHSCNGARNLHSSVSSGTQSALTVISWSLEIDHNDVSYMEWIPHRVSGVNNLYQYKILKKFSMTLRLQSSYLVMHSNICGIKMIALKYLREVSELRGVKILHFYATICSCMCFVISYKADLWIDCLTMTWILPKMNILTRTPCFNIALYKCFFAWWL